MADKVFQTNKIYPESFYADTDLLLLLSIGADTQEKARNAGRLAGTKTGTGFLYKGEAVLKWLEDGAPTEPASARGDANTRQHRPASGSPARSTPKPVFGGETMATNNPIAEFNARVEQQMQRSLDRRQAVRAVVKADPALHKSYLLATNADRPKAQRSLAGSRSTPKHVLGGETMASNANAIAEFNAAVERQVQNGLARRQAVRAVVKANPDLHTAYLAATNKPHSIVQGAIKDRHSMIGTR